jgi:threonyl-tRNA synthetase
MVHRAILGSFERFMGALIEHFAGKFPFWLAPEQVAVIPIREEHFDYARDLSARMEREGFRVRCMDEPSHMNKRIKQAQGDQTPFMLIVGEREAEEGTCAVRPRGTRDQTVMKFDDFLERARDLRASRALELPELG